MSFELSSDHKMIQQTLRDFAAREVRPTAGALSEEERFPEDILGKLAELGMLGVEVPEEYGGAGLDTLASAVVLEELARQDGSVAAIVSAHNGLALRHILLSGSDALKAEVLPKLATGEWLGAWAVAEEEGGASRGAMATIAEREGDGWILNGAKAFVTLGDVAHVCVVVARTGEGELTAFLVDTASDGYQVTRRIPTHGVRAAHVVDIRLDGLSVPDSRRLGAVGQGLSDVTRVADAARINLAAIAVGLGRGAVEEGGIYASERIQFGRPIADFQAIQWKLADSATEIDAARLLMLRAAVSRDDARPFAREAAMAKLFASGAAVRACNEAIQIHGGYGYTVDFPVERLWRDARLTTIADGTPEVLRLAIARDILRAFHG